MGRKTVNYTDEPIEQLCVVLDDALKGKNRRKVGSYIGPVYSGDILWTCYDKFKTIYEEVDTICEMCGKFLFCRQVGGKWLISVKREQESGKGIRNGTRWSQGKGICKEGRNEYARSEGPGTIWRHDKGES